LGQLIVIVAMLAVLWIVLIRPQRRRQVAQQQLHASVSVGDEILTAGGLYGRVKAVGDGDELVVEIAPGTDVRVARRAVAAVLDDEAEGELEPTASEDPS
jgi:preprotein translocase subunit YajC